MIRAATPSDAQAIAEIWNRVIQDTNITFTSVEKTQASIAEQIATTPVFVAEGPTIQGFSTYGPFRSGPGYRFVAEHSIHIDPGAHRQGLGRALLVALEAVAIENDIDTLIGAMTGDNHRSIAFHQSCGFTQVGYLPGVGAKFGARHDLVLMQKHLHVSH